MALCALIPLTYSLSFFFSLSNPSIEPSSRTGSNTKRQVTGDNSSGGRQNMSMMLSIGDTDSCVLPSRSSSPSLSARSSSPASVTKRRSASRNSDSGYLVKQTKSSTLRRCCSMMVNLPSSDTRNQSVTRNPSVRASSNARFSRSATRNHSFELDINQNYNSNDSNDLEAIRTGRSRHRQHSSIFMS